MKIIFLDIDGVMKPGRAYWCDVRRNNIEGGFDPLAVAAINRICRRTGASVVFNTTWNELEIVQIAQKEGVTALISGKTRYPDISDRLAAIQHYLHDHPAEQWIAIDDAEIDHPNAILVNSDDGISAQNYRDACRLLGNPDRFGIMLE